MNLRIEKLQIKGVEPLPGPKPNLSFDKFVNYLIKDKLLVLN